MTSSSENKVSQAEDTLLTSAPLWDIAVNAPLPPLSYLGGSLDPGLQPGQVVEVPLGPRKTVGVVLERNKEPEQTLQKFFEEGVELKEVLSVREDLPLWPLPYMKWVQWLSDYYIYPIGLIYKHAMPPLRTAIRKRPRL